MRKRLLQLAGIGLVGALLLAGLPWAVLAQTATVTGAGPGPAQVTPTAVPGVTATPLPTNTPRPTSTPTETPVAVTATPAVMPSPRVEATVTPAELPITGNQSAVNAAASLLPLLALLLLAIPALGGLRARRR